MCVSVRVYEGLRLCVHAYVCVYMYVCDEHYLCVFASMYVYTFVCVCVYVRMCMYACVRVSACICSRMCMHAIVCGFVHAYVCMYTNAWEYAHVYVFNTHSVYLHLRWFCMYIGVRLCMRMLVCIHMRMCETFNSRI